MLVYLLLLQASLPGVIHVVHVVADRVAKRLLFRSPVFTPHIDLRVSMDSFDLLTYRGVWWGRQGVRATRAICGI